MEVQQLCLLLLIPLCKGIVAQTEEESIVELQLADYDLIDAYDEISQASRNYLLNPGTQKVKIQLEKHRGELLRLQSVSNREITYVPADLIRNWSLLTNSGDFLLPQLEFNTLIDFANSVENIATITNNSGVDEQGYIQGLKLQRNNATALANLWSSWQNLYNSYKSAFPPILNLLNKAYVPNEEHSVMAYWEMLSEYQNGYKQAENLWKEVEPLYKLLHEFVRIRIQNYYKISNNFTSIPVYLLGSNFGEDWSNIANIVLPHLKLYEEIREALKGQSVEKVFRFAETTTRKLGLGALGKQFWTKSNFRQANCDLRLFSNCAEKYTEVLTCDKVDLTLFMDIHESAMDIALRNQDYSSLARRDLRFSAVDEALRGLGSIIALESLSEYGFISEKSLINYHDQNDRKNIELLIQGLRVLPKLPYYLLSDVTRLDHLENQQEVFTEAWWRNRMKLQGVQGISNEEVDYLGDTFISLNKPRLSKYLGIFLQFQLVEYYKNYYYFENGNIATFIKNDENFRKFIQDRPNKDWVQLLEFHYAISEISSESLLNYFKPLETYLKEALLEPIPTTPSDSIFHTTLLTKQVISTAVSSANDQSDETNVLQSTAAAGIEGKKAGTSNVIIWAIVGVAGVITVGIIVVLFVRRSKRRKRRTNNRRFET